MEEEKRMIDAGFDVTGENLIVSYIDTKAGVLETVPELTVSRQQWQAFLKEPGAEDCPVRDLLDELKKRSGSDRIRGLIITMEPLTESHIIEVMSAAEIIGFDRHHLRLISPGESILHYMIHQKKDIWSNAVVVFDYKEDRFMMRKMTITGLRLPKQLKITQRDLTGLIDIRKLETEEEQKKADQDFLEVIREEFRKNVVSGVILMGKLFELTWMKQSLNFMCERRKVFLGNHIYAEGSCYAALRLFGKQDPGDYYFDCEGRTKINIDLAIVHHGRSAVLSLSKAGAYWYKASVRIQVLLGREKELKFILTDPVKKKTWVVFLEMDDLPKRPEKTSRVDVQVMCYGDSSYEFIAQDMGFGEFFESSGLVVSKKVILSDGGLEEKDDGRFFKQTV